MFAESIDPLSSFFASQPRILQPDMLLRIAVQIMLFSASSFFSGSETALFSLSKFDLQRLTRRKNAAADTLNSLLEQPRRLIVSILCGNELVNIAAAANMTAILIELVGIQTATWMATVVMVPLILLLGEVTPKTLAVINPVWASTRIVATPISWWVRVVGPLAFLVRAISDRITTLLVGPERAQENILHVEELETLIEEGVESGEISPTERFLVQNLIYAGAAGVSEIMTPRTKVVFINAELKKEEILEKLLSQQHPRVPVYAQNRDNVIGFLYIEDVHKWSMLSNEEFNLDQYLHPALAVPTTREVDEMLDYFKEQEERAALVVSESGGIEGIITLHDITRFLFSGVFEEASPNIANIKIVEGAYEVDGWMPIPEVRRLTGFNISDPSMTTIAGFALRLFGYVPGIGEHIEVDELKLTVIELENLRISRIRIERNVTPIAGSSKESL